MSIPSSDCPTSNPVDVPVVLGPPQQAQQLTEKTRRVTDRVNATLEHLGQLCRELEDGNYVPKPEYLLPPGFVLSIVIPVYNEVDTVLPLLSRVCALPITKQVVIVDDHSTDGTTDILRQIKSMPDLEIVFKTDNEGKGAALRTGFSHVTGDIVVVQDADMEYDPRDILDLLRPIILGDADVVYGSRFLEEGTAVGSSFVHRLGNGLLTKASNLTTGLQLTDMETCYKVFRKNVINQIQIQQDRFGFEPEITAKIARRGWRVMELPISYKARRWSDGKKIGFKDLLDALYCIIRYGWKD